MSVVRRAAIAVALALLPVTPPNALAATAQHSLRGRVTDQN
jgi:hypothetical protein